VCSSDLTSRVTSRPAVTAKVEKKPEISTGQAQVERKVEKPVAMAVKEANQPLVENGNIDLDQLSKAWRQIRGLIKPQSPSLDGLLNSCRLLEIKNNTLVIGFASELLRSKVEMPELIDITRKAILEVCGSDLSIKCVVTNAKHAPPPNVKADGMVAAALKAGGEIVDTQE
jgi:hypothetical protein